jgi:peptidoglycan/xylan/chitin deacetylase (PgdA/CDA1 family)
VTVRYVQGKASGKRVALERVALVAPKVVQVALTFDDGPTPAYTPRVLSALAKYGAHATFFVLGDMASHWPGLVRREAAGGNEVCIHTWNHPMMTRVSAARLDAEVLRSARLVAHLAGTARWFRPPYGGINAHVRARVAALGFHTVLWDVDTSDWRKPPPSTIAARIVNGARNGRVILMHDGGGDRSRTVAALAIALPRLRARGVRMVTLSQLRGLVPAPPTTVLVADAQGKAAYALAALTVVVNGRELAPAPLAARREGHLLLAAKPVLHALGVPLAWDAGAEALVVDSMHGRAVVRANSRRLTLDGREVLLTAPALRVEGQVLAPVGLLAQLGNAVVSLRPGGGPVTFDAVARPTDDGAPRPGQAPPAGAGLVPRADGLVPH